MRCVLTDKKIQSFKPTHRRQEFWDMSLPSFGIRVSKNGQKTFFVMCREQNKQKRITLGRYPLMTLSVARDLARDKIRLVSQGMPIEEKKPSQITVEEVFASFIDIYTKTKNKDWKKAERRLRISLIKDFGHLDIRDVKRQHIIAMLDKIVARDAPIQANRVLAGTSTFFKWCIERGYVDANPTLYVSKRSKENPRDRVLSDDEIRLIWEQTEKMGYPYGPLFQILMLTGQRKGEVSDMRWSEVNFKEKTWVIPKERSKNGHSHSIPLSENLLDLLNKIPRFLHSDYVFTTTGRVPVSGFGKIKSRLDKACGVSNWVIHDIRRTVASNMARLEIPPYIVEKILNHISGTFSSVAGVYNRYGYDKEKREALNKWAEHILPSEFFSGEE